MAKSAGMRIGLQLFWPLAMELPSAPIIAVYRLFASARRPKLHRWIICLVLCDEMNRSRIF